MRYTDFILELKGGEAFVEEGRYAEALKVCDEVLAKMSDHAAAYDLKSVCYIKMGDMERAEESVRTALKYMEGSSPIHAHLGFILEEQGREAEALKAYEDAIRYDHTYAPGFVGRGRMRMFHLYDADGSLSDFTEAIELDPEEADQWYLRGLCLLGKGNVSEAKKDLAEAVKIKPELKEDAGRAVEEYLKAVEDPYLGAS